MVITKDLLSGRLALTFITLVLWFSPNVHEGFLFVVSVEKNKRSQHKMRNASQQLGMAIGGLDTLSKSKLLSSLLVIYRAI